MKRPNELFNRKYLSSLVIAAFLILSVLTAYNLQFGSGETDKADTEVEETIGNSDDVISEGEARVEEEQNGEEAEDSLGESRNMSGQEEEDGSGPNVGGDRKDNEDEDDDSEDDNDDEDDDEDSDDENSDDEDSAGRRSQTDTSEGEAQESGGNFRYDGSSKLTWPLVGNVVLPYSMDTTVYYTTLDQYACNDGILIGAKKGREVVAVADGRIVNIAESDRYGTTVTLLIGKYYEVFYSQIENVQYEIGDEVKEGDVIATVAEPTRAFTLEGPHLFFKMTYKGEPVNPTEYLHTDK